MKKRPRPRPAVVALDHRQLDLPLFDGPAAAPSAPAAPPAPPDAAPGAAPAPDPARDRSRVRPFVPASRAPDYRLERPA
ncbi:metal-dependent hydrolase, partial [Paraburkholderia sp. Se-20369]|nr:metal-dependent hydrolase [Paraburkholderia sp. Se-20369]